MVKTVWEYSIKTEAERLLHCAHQMAVGFYRVNNFIVLPYTPKIGGAHIVTFPDLPYNKIPRFWEKIKKIDIQVLPIRVNKSILEQTAKLLEKADLPAPEFENTKNQWGKAQNEILSEIYRIIPSKKGSIKEIIIYPTSFGTSTSFNWLNANGKIIMYLRQDQSIASITEAIITSLTRKDIFEKLDGVWQESEIVTDWIITQSSLAAIVKKYDQTPFLPTIKGVRIKQQARLIEKSDRFYQKLGLPVNPKVFSLNGLTPEINKKPVENLSALEKSVLRLLIQKSNNVATFDELGDATLKNEENYSLYAIAKTIERLRNKLEANGISSSCIQTLRGQGYVLRN